MNHLGHPNNESPVPPPLRRDSMYIHICTPSEWYLYMYVCVVYIVNDVSVVLVLTVSDLFLLLFYRCFCLSSLLYEPGQGFTYLSRD